MKIIRLTSLPLDMPYLSSPKPWQATCSSLFAKSDPKLVYFLFHFVASPSSSSFSFPNSPNYSSPRKSALVYTNYLRSYFSDPKLKILRSTARTYFSELRRATCSKDSHYLICPAFFFAKFLAAAIHLFSFPATCHDKAAYPMQKHIPRCGTNFLLHVFNLSWSLHFFPSIWKRSFITTLMSPFLFCTKLFFGPFSFMLHSNGSFSQRYQRF